MGYKGFVFDLDGTLVHTSPEYRYELVGKILGHLGARAASQQCVDNWWFRSERDATIRNQFGVEPAAFWETCRTYETEEFRRQHISAYEDVTVLKELKALGPIGVVTGAPRHIALLEIGLVERVVGVKCVDALIIAKTIEGVRPKPHPDGLQLCLEKLGLGAHEAPYIGNAHEDVLAAKAAGMHSLLVDRGEHEFDAHLDPDYRMVSLYALKDITSGNRQTS